MKEELEKKGDPNRMPIRLAIVGTRVLDCPGDKDRTSERILKAIRKLEPDVIISGGAKGVDSLAELEAALCRYSEAKGNLIIHRPTVKRFHGEGGYRERDELIARDCTHLLRIACKQATTYGSGWTANRAEELGKVVVRWNPC